MGIQKYWPFLIPDKKTQQRKICSNSKDYNIYYAYSLTTFEIETTPKIIKESVNKNLLRA